MAALQHNDPAEAKAEDSVIVVDNYDSFTYNLCQVFYVAHDPLQIMWK